MTLSRARLILVAALAVALLSLLLPSLAIDSGRAETNISATPGTGDLIANLHSDFAFLRGDLAREQGVNLIGASVVSDAYPGGEPVGRLTFWWLGWPAEARHTSLSRALAQIDVIDQLVAAHPGLRTIRSKTDLDEVKAHRTVGLLVCMEGAHPFVGDATRVGTFFERGVRVVSLTHLYNDELGGSGSPTIPLTNLYLGAERGLTDQGRQVLSEMAKYGMILDLAHTSRKTFDDALAVWSGPVMVSHTAMAAVYPSKRNLTDEQVQSIAQRGGIVGIMAQTQFLGGKDLSALAENIAHAAHIAGADHVALGLDMEDVVDTMPRGFHDTRDIEKLTPLLLQRGLNAEQIKGVYGINAVRFFSNLLPGP